MSPLTRYWKTLRHHLGPQWPKLAVLGVLLLVTTGLQVVNPQLVRLFIDAAVGAGAETAAQSEETGRTLAWAAVVFLGVGWGWRISCCRRWRRT